MTLRTISLVLTLVVFVGHKTLASRPRHGLEDYITGLTLVVFVGHKTLASRPRRDLEDYITGFNIGSVCRS